MPNINKLSSPGQSEEASPSPWDVTAEDLVEGSSEPKGKHFKSNKTEAEAVGDKARDEYLQKYRITPEGKFMLPESEMSRVALSHGMTLDEYLADTIRRAEQAGRNAEMAWQMKQSHPEHTAIVAIVSANEVDKALATPESASAKMINALDSLYNMVSANYRTDDEKQLSKLDGVDRLIQIGADLSGLTERQAAAAKLESESRADDHLSLIGRMRKYNVFTRQGRANRQHRDAIRQQLERLPAERSDWRKQMEDLLREVCRITGRDEGEWSDSMTRESLMANYVDIERGYAEAPDSKSKLANSWHVSVADMERTARKRSTHMPHNIMGRFSSDSRSWTNMNIR